MIASLLRVADLRERSRRERIGLLLRSRNDAYAGLAASAIPTTAAGPAPSRFVRCPACEGRGRIGTTARCPSCDGKKRIALDSYTGRVASSETRRPEPMSPERLESELQHLQLGLSLAAGEIDPSEAYGWELAVERRDRSGSYRELERALEILRERIPYLWQFAAFVYASGLEVELDWLAQLVNEVLLAELSRLMPERIRLPRLLHHWLMEEKRRLVFAHLELGVEAISELVLLSPRTVEKILGPRAARAA